MVIMEQETVCGCGRPTCTGCGPGTDCDGTSTCGDSVHAEDCLAPHLSDAEIANGVFPPDDEMRRRRDLYRS